MDKLKVCPFCGGEAFCYERNARKGYEFITQCNNCLAFMDTITYDSREKAEQEAIKAWNNRAELEKYKQKLVEKLNQRHKSNIKHSKDGDCLQMTIYENRVVEDVAIIKLIESGELE